MEPGARKGVRLLFLYSPFGAEAGSTEVRDGESLARATIVKNYSRLIGMTVADRLTVLATGAVVAVSIIGGSCSTNARIGDTTATRSAQ